MDYEISVQEVEEKIKSGEPIALIDIREPNELENGMIAEAVSMPMGEINERMGEIDPHKEVIVICRSGSRSLRVTEFLAQSGFTRVKNMTGGMNRWATEIDQSMQVY